VGGAVIAGDESAQVALAMTAGDEPPREAP
jgi:hypothetical protein